MLILVLVVVGDSSGGCRFVDVVDVVDVFSFGFTALAVMQQTVTCIISRDL